MRPSFRVWLRRLYAEPEFIGGLVKQPLPVMLRQKTAVIRDRPDALRVRDFRCRSGIIRSEHHAFEPDLLLHGLHDTGKMRIRELFEALAGGR